MKRVYLAADPINAEIVKDYLASYGIETIVRDAILWGGLGEIPVDTYPSVWVLEDAEAEQARALVAEFEHGGKPKPDWQCPDCGERLSGEFTHCWRCSETDGEWVGKTF